eukprot:1338337-Amorphochlora_amoeboformis.AAC.1
MRFTYMIDHLNSVKSRLEGKEITIKQLPTSRFWPRSPYTPSHQKRSIEQIYYRNPPKAKRIREDVEWYVESNQEPDFVVDEFLYDAIDDEDSDKEEKEENVE